MSTQGEALKAGFAPSYFLKLEAIAAGIGLNIEHKGFRRVRGWPVKSEKPWSLRNADATLVCAFRTLDQLERNLRGRAGC